MSCKLEDLMNFNRYPGSMKVKSISRLRLVKEIDDNSIVYTPEWVVEQMLDLLPTEIWSDPNATFLDPCCKYGVFLEKIYWRLIEGLKDIIPNELERSAHILTKQLYGLALSTVTAENTRVVLYGTSRANHKNAFVTGFTTAHGNIMPLHIIDEKETYSYKDVVGDESRQLVNRVIRKGFGKEMKFDVVIGNPPYNKGMDIDFVNLGFDLCTRYCVMITPAKWQTAEADQRIVSQMTYGEFREKLVPHMSRVVFYPSCKDVFDIYQTDGITYYKLDKGAKVDKCIVTNISKTRGHIYNSTEIRSIRNGESLLNIGNEIIESLEPYEKFKFPVISGTKRFRVMTNTQVSGYDWYKEHGPRYVLSISRIIDTEAGEKSSSGASKATFEADTREECEYFISWLNTKFTRFFLIPNLSKLTAICDQCFRFVPAPPSGKFDHIYTDEELYEAFNLPQKYIDLIEELVRERD